MTTETDAHARAGFKVAEPAFPMRDNDAEMKVLAAAVLEQICRAGEQKLRVLASYAVAVAEHRELKRPLPELPAAATESLAGLAASQRKPLLKPEVKRSVLTKDMKTALEDYPATQFASTTATKELLQSISTWMQAGLSTAATHTAAVAEWADHNARLASEDANLLWWLLSGSSRTLGEPWSALPTRTLAVVAGRELASAAVVLPAPPQSTALLQQLISANPRPKKPVSEAEVEALDAPEALGFLLTDLTSGEHDQAPVLGLACHSLDQAMLVRAWNELE